MFFFVLPLFFSIDQNFIVNDVDLMVFKLSFPRGRYKEQGVDL